SWSSSSFSSGGGICSSLCSGGFFSGLGSSDTLLGLLAWLTLGWVIAGVALDQASVGEEACNAVGRQRTVGHPVLDALFVDGDAVAVLGQHRVPCADLLDETAVARGAHVSDDDVVVRALLGTCARKTDFQCHFEFSWICSLFVVLGLGCIRIC